MTLAELFNSNYSELYLAARRITRRKNIRLAPELVSETYISLQDKNHACQLTGDEFIKWFSKCMKNVYSWPNSSFNKSSRLQSIDYGDFDVPDTEALSSMILAVEETNTATKELIEVSSGMQKDRVLRYIEVIEFKNSLPPHEKILFDLYFINGLSSRKISEYMLSDTGYHIHFKRINKMVNTIKSKINSTKWG